MRHYSAGDFLPAPGRRNTEADLTRRLLHDFKPHERAKADAQRVDDEPAALAAAFLAEVEHSRSIERATVRGSVLAAIEANVDATGALVMTVTPEDLDHRVAAVETQLAGLRVEHRKDAATAKDGWRRGSAAFLAWMHDSGAKHRSKPWPQPASYALTVSAAALAETWLAAQVLAGPPIVGVPPPILLGLIFAVGSIFAGALFGLGHMLGTHKRRPFRLAGFGVLVAVVLGWFALSLLGAHMRAVIEDGGGGSAKEIVASLHHGLFTPLASPLALMLAAASAVTTAVMWYETVTFWGAPFGYRRKDSERQWGVDRLYDAEETQTNGVKALVAGVDRALEALLAHAWAPANDGLRLERELALVLTPARERERAIDRAHRAVLNGYGATFRHVRPGTDLRHVLALEPQSGDDLGEPALLRERVEALHRSAAVVDAAARTAKLRLRRIEFDELAKIDALYTDTRPRTADASRTYSNNLPEHTE
jgi:hypothetical protein